MNRSVIVAILFSLVAMGCQGPVNQDPSIESDPSFPPVRIGPTLVARDCQSLFIYDRRTIVPSFESRYGDHDHGHDIYDHRSSGKLEIELNDSPAFAIQEIPDMSALGDLQNLRRLMIRGLRNPVDTKFLESLENLESLDFYCSRVDRLEIRNLKKLKYLILSYSQLQNLEGLPDQLKLLVVTDGIPESEIEEYKRRNSNVNVVPTAPDDCRNLTP
ncbi:MAG: hypothetical protein RH862_02530 [Leptospiraceae bacterium]